MVNSGEPTKLMEAARALRPRILAERERIEAARRLPEDLTQELARAGFFRIYLPAAYGGLDLTPMAATEVFEELARADASVAWCVWNGNTYWTTVQWPKEVAQAIFADPDTILANSTRPSGRAVVVEGGYRVSGRWSLVSGCQFSAWFILMCIELAVRPSGIAARGVPVRGRQRVEQRVELAPRLLQFVANALPDLAVTHVVTARRHG
jgi:alkylation response protein AidB-like acyl-CoA dehydrogenase